VNERVRIGKIPIDRVTKEHALAAVERLVASGAGGTIFTPNVDHVVLAERDADLARAYEDAALSLVDGMPVLWASRLLGARLPEKISGSDFVPELLDLAARRAWRVYLLGGADGSAERAAESLRARDVNIVGVASPRIELHDGDAATAAYAPIVSAIADASAHLVLVGLGAPKQERFAHAVAKRLAPAVLLGVGATIDFIAGAVPRAPPWMSRSGLEWLYRLAREPRRLWRRYLIRDPKFAAVVWKQVAFAETLEKVGANVAAYASAPARLRDCDRVGARARTRRAPVVENLGTIEIGDDFQVNNAFVPSVFQCGAGGAMRIGDGVNVNFGARISATHDVTIGSRVSLGPHVVIADHDGDGDGAPASVTIGDGVWLAARVRVEKGVTIGEGTVVTAGSVVESSLPPRVVAGGSPARVLRTFDGSDEARPTARTASPERAMATVQGIVVADFTATDLAEAIARDDDPVIAAEVAPFDQVVQTLDALSRENAARDFAFVWTRPERVSPAFARLLRGERVDGDVLEDVDAFADRLLAVRGARFVFVPTWTLPPHVRGLGVLDLRPGGIARALAAMNLRLAERLERSPTTFVLDAARWMVGDAPFSARLWYMGKIGFSRAVLEAASRDLHAALRAVRGEARKLLVLDLDDTLWGGIVGDVGWQHLRLGGHDPIGEALVDFQRAVLALSRRGVALAIASKNEESIALDAIRSHPEMVLALEHFAAWRIDWCDKAQNVAAIARELNLGLQSIVFVDDNPHERARVREALPEVLVPDWPSDPTRYVEALESLRCFDVASLSEEDAARSRMYARERERRSERSNVASLDEWLDALGTIVRIAPLDASTLPRTAQLLNKTNQMNLRTRRMSERELVEWSRVEGHEVWTAHVSDKHDDAGLTGIVGIDFDGDVATLADFVLSCRVMGRRVEETLLWFAIGRGRARGAGELRAPFVATAKNAPCLALFTSQSAFAREGDVFVWNAARDFERPRGVEIVVRGGT
jgi:exopolysaccharide biosynthesis WecB/TagA/CpsF family protein